jgi:hypothetical protein
LGNFVALLEARLDLPADLEGRAAMSRRYHFPTYVVYDPKRGYLQERQKRVGFQPSTTKPPTAPARSRYKYSASQTVNASDVSTTSRAWRTKRHGRLDHRRRRHRNTGWLNLRPRSSASSQPDRRPYAITAAAKGSGVGFSCRIKSAVAAARARPDTPVALHP